MKKRGVKKSKSRRTYKSVTPARVTFENTNRAKPYTVKKRTYKLSRAIKTKGKNEQKFEAKLMPKLRKAATSFYKSRSKKSTKVFLVRLSTRRIRGKGKKKSGFSLRTRKTESKKDFDNMIDELIESFKSKVQKYGEGLSEFDITGYEFQEELKSGKKRRKQKSKAISTRRKLTKKGH